MRWAIAGIAVAGALVRLGLADYSWPATGDSVFSYAYRALLLAHGERDGLFLMWHPPGYPLLLAVLTRLSAGLASPYAWGIALSVGLSAVLVWIVDRLVAERVRWPVTRLAVAGFVAFYEGLVTVSAAPLTEPVYLVLLYGALLLAAAERISWGRAAAIGALLGLAGTIRTEAVAPLAGLTAFLGFRALRGREPWTFAAIPAAALAVGGWALARLVFSRGLDPVSYYAAAYTVPPAAGLAGNLRRAVECAYLAMTDWLPQTVLLPWLVLAAVGLAASWNSPRMDWLNRLLLITLGPQAALAALTTMTKRTGAFLLPAVAIWCALGLEFLVRRLRGLPPARRAAIASSVFLAATALQLGRMGFYYAKRGTTRDPATLQQAKLLENAAAPPGKVWAFGGEPEVYAFWEQPVVYPFPDRETVYNPLYRAHAGRPAEFVAALRGAGFSYLTFSLAPSGREDGLEPQMYGGFSGEPRREDLEQLAAAPARFGLDPLGSLPADRGTRRVYAFRIGGSR